MWALQLGERQATVASTHALALCRRPTAAGTVRYRQLVGSVSSSLHDGRQALTRVPTA